MKNYQEIYDRKPDFRIKYEKYETSQRLFQHIRTDFKFLEDESNIIVWMIWPEFEDNTGRVISSSEDVESYGTASMWILNTDEKYRSELNKRLYVGAKGYLVAGSMKLAEAEVIQLIEKHENV